MQSQQSQAACSDSDDLLHQILCFLSAQDDKLGVMMARIDSLNAKVDHLASRMSNSSNNNACPSDATSSTKPNHAVAEELEAKAANNDWGNQEPANWGDDDEIVDDADNDDACISQAQPRFTALIQQLRAIRSVEDAEVFLYNAPPEEIASHVLTQLVSNEDFVRDIPVPAKTALFRGLPPVCRRHLCGFDAFSILHQLSSSTTTEFNSLLEAICHELGSDPVRRRLFGALRFKANKKVNTHVHQKILKLNLIKVFFEFPHLGRFIKPGHKFSDLPLIFAPVSLRISIEQKREDDDDSTDTEEHVGDGVGWSRARVDSRAKRAKRRSLDRAATASKCNFRITILAAHSEEIDFLSVSGARVFGLLRWLLMTSNVREFFVRACSPPCDGVARRVRDFLKRHITMTTDQMLAQKGVSSDLSRHLMNFWQPPVRLSYQKLPAP